MNIITSSAYMKYANSISSQLETECLFGEKIEILDQNLDWFYCRLVTDDYHGWIQASNLGQLDKITHRVLSPRTYIYKEANPKSNVVMHLTLGSQLCIEKIKDEWAKTYFLVNNIIEFGYIPTKHIVEIGHKVSDWVAVAERLEGTPYKWGGRDTVGLDCSALLQLAYQTYGEILPRNTSEQINLKKPNINIIDKLKRGCVVFWKGHVGIMVDRFNCIHANAYHMKTTTEPLIDIINRINKENQIVKMMDFN
ncbi:C40 family peptidase [Alphaproteobacteria bacterium]|nr:C40 family peptidase [Alphaproteobacteria bacterium]MDC1085893.1 NlpC/P60 family protein [Alphaproteobacteria bacterium]